MSAARCPRCAGALGRWGADACCYACGWAGPTRAPTAADLRSTRRPGGRVRQDDLDAEVLLALREAAEAGGGRARPHDVAARLGRRIDGVREALERLRLAGAAGRSGEGLGRQSWWTPIAEPS